MSKKTSLVLWMDKVGIKDVEMVGGKNASLGEMLQKLSKHRVRVPSGFVVTAHAYREFIKEAGLADFVKEALKGLDTHNVRDLSVRASKIRKAIISAELPEKLKQEIEAFYRSMEKKHGRNTDVAVRSSATAEDLPGASFAGEHETYLGVRGTKDVLTAVKSAMASLFTDRAISYREDKGFGHFKVALSVTVQHMVRSDKGSSGVMFTVDTESGFKDVVLINAVWGLGEMIVQGKVTPDEFFVHKSGIEKAKLPIISKKMGAKQKKMVYDSSKKGIKPVKIVPTTPAERKQFVLTDKEIMTLAKWGKLIEEHYSRVHKTWTPMDIEWAKDGNTGELYIVQARPETVQVMRDLTKVKSYTRTQDGPVLTEGISVGSRVASGTARVIMDVKDINSFKKGEILVTDMTDPDWEPIMKIASGIVTDKGGRTSHAAIVSRELGIPAVVGSETATKVIKTGQDVTLDTVGSAGVVFKGKLKFKVSVHDLGRIPETKTKIMVNIGTPDTAFEKSFLPHKGVGLAREEFILASTIAIHPLALLNIKTASPKLRKAINIMTVGWDDKVQFFVDNLSYGIAKIAAAFAPYPVIVRFSDFKTNEYLTLLGGDQYEPKEENPMLGWRGASRYYDPKFKDAFGLEVKALRKVREEMGLTNVIPMVPFCRTPEEGEKVLHVMMEYGLIAKSMQRKAKRSKDSSVTPVYMMCEIPSNVILAEEFLNLFDGMSIGSNDLTQLVLGLDRDGETVSHVANEKHRAVKHMVSETIKVCKKRKKYVGICGQAPSDHPTFMEFLVDEGIESMSLTPDTVIPALIRVAQKEKKVKGKRKRK